MRRFGRKLKLAVLWTSAVCLTLAVLLFALSITSYFILLYPSVQARAVRFAEAKMAEFFVGEITVERLESNLLSYVDLYGVRAVGKSVHGDTMYVGHASIRYWVPSLAKKRLNVTSAVVTDVRGHVVMEEDNKIMIPLLPRRMVDSTYTLLSKIYGEERKMNSDHIPNPADWPVEVVLGRTRVYGINAVYRDLSNDMVGEIKNASAQARFHTLDSFTVHLQVPDASYRSPWWDGTIDTIGAHGTITWKGLEVHSLLLEGSGTRVTGGGRLSYFPDGPWDLRADFKTLIRPVPILYAYLDDLDRNGVLEGTAHFGGKLYEPLYSAKVKSGRIRLRGYDITGFNVEASYGADEYGRARVRGNTAFGQFDVSAGLLMEHLNDGPEFGDYSAYAVLSGLNAKRIADEFGAGLPIRIEDANVRLRAAGAAFEIPSAVNLSAELGGGDIAGGALSLGADIKGENWNIEGSWGANRYSANGKADWATMAVNGHASAELNDPSAVSQTFFKERVAGRISASADIEGHLDKLADLSVSASAVGDGIVWRGMRADSLNAAMTVADGVPRLSEAGAKLSGRIDSVASYFGQNALRGHTEAIISMSGGFDDPSVRARVRGDGLRYHGHGLAEASGVFALEKDTVRWHDLRLKEKNTLLRGSGKMKISGDMEIAADGEFYRALDGGADSLAGKLRASGSLRGDTLRAKCRLTSASLELLDPWIPEKHRVKGALSLSGDFYGAVKNPGGRVNFQIASPRYYGNQAFTFVGDATLADSLVQAVALLRLKHNSGPVEVVATLPFLPASGWKLDEAGNRATFVRANARDFDIAATAGFLGPDFSVSGAVSFDARATNTGSGWNLGGTLALPGGAVRYIPNNINAGSVSLNASAAGTLDNPRIAYTLTTGAVTMDSMSMAKGVIRGRGTRDTLYVDESRFTFRENSYIDASGVMLCGNIDSLLYNRNFYAQYTIRNFHASFFSHLLPGYNLRKGLFNGSGVVYADGGRPMVDGALYLTRLELTIPDITPEVGPIEASVKLSGNAIELVSAEAKWGRGAATAAGRAYWDADSIYGMDINVRAAALSFELPEVIHVGVENANLRLLGRSDSMSVQGKIALAPTSYTRDFNIMTVINQMQTAGVDMRREPDPFLSKVRLWVDLDLASNMNVNVDLGNVYMNGRLKIAGTAAEPGIVGEVRVTEGFVYYLDRKFSIAEGTLFNSDMTALNPNLNITAKSDVVTMSPNSKAEMFTITLTLLGTFESPVVRLTSEPALGELDIISVLTFGERMGGIGSDVSDRLMNIAAQQALGLGTRQLERMLNLDKVSVSGDILGPGSSTIGVTKRFSSRLNLTYETNMGNLSDQKVTAQYRLRPNLFLEGQTANNGENALDLIFRYSR